MSVTASGFAYLLDSLFKRTSYSAHRYPPASPRLYGQLIVLESQPVVHRLRILCLDLGPDLPWVDEPSPGNLRLSTGEILTHLSLLMPAFSLVCNPILLTLCLLLTHIAPLPSDDPQLRYLI